MLGIIQVLLEFILTNDLIQVKLELNPQVEKVEIQEP